MISPGSRCPHCQQALRPWHKIPLVSYLVLGGRCAYCHLTIPIRYPLVEGLCGLLYIGLYQRFGLTAEGWVFALLVTALLIISCIDLAYKIIPDVITLPGIPAGILASLFLTPISVASSALGMLVGGTLFFLVAWLSRGGMGGGDIKLIAMIGAFVGWPAVLITIFFGALSGALVGGGLILWKKKGRKDAIPFAPFLALGALFALGWGDDFLVWYTRLSW